MSATQRLGAPVSLRAVSRDDRTIEIVASDFSKDSYNTRIDPNGWELQQFIRNPVILAFHNDYKFPVARAIPDTIRIDGGALRMTVQFPAKGKYAEADVAFELYADGYMRGVSVGFMPLSWEDREEGEGEEKKTVRIYTKAKLLEVSLVPIPSNDNALAQRAVVLNQNADEVKQRTEELEKLMDERSQQFEVLEHNGVCVEVRITDMQEFKAFKQEFKKLAGYFEKKQPVNKAASKVLERFYKRILDEEAPENEVEAWNRMAEAVEALEEQVEIKEDIEEQIVEEEQTPEEVSVVPEQTIEEKETTEESEEESTMPNPEPVEAPQDAQEAPVQLSLDTLAKLPDLIRKTCVEAAVEASRQGVPQKELGAVIEATGKQFLSAIFPPQK